MEYWGYPVWFPHIRSLWNFPKRQIKTSLLETDLIVVLDHGVFVTSSESSANV